jgi:uncharacterized protein GlcG (DUF336 family)
MSELTLAQASTIIEAAFAKSAELKFKPLTVAVLDAGGHLKAFQKQDGSSMLRFEIAFGKAYGALGVGAGSRWLHATALDRPHFVQALTAMADGRLIPVPGGVLIRDGEGKVIGAVGISGDTSDNDEIAAVAGIEAAGFTADKG